MATPEPLQILITARDEASRVLGTVGRQLDMFQDSTRRTTPALDNLEQSTVRFDRSLRQAGGGVRVLAYPLVAELSPALGTTTSRMASVIAGAATLGGGFGAVAIAATGLAAIVGGRLVTSWRESTAAAEAYSRAVAVGDVQALTTAMGKQADEVLTLSRAYAALEENARRARAAETGPEGGAGGASFFAAEGGGQLSAAQARLRAIALDRERAEGAKAEGEALLEAERQLRRINEERAKLQAANVLADRGLGAGRLGPIETIERQFRDTRQLADDRAAAGDPEGAARLRQEATRQRAFALRQRRTALGVAFAAGAPVNPFETAAGQEAERRAREAALVAEDAERQARIKAFQAGAPVSPFETPGGQEAERRGRETLAVADDEREKAALSSQQQTLVGLLEVERARREIAGQLTPEMEAQFAIAQSQLIAANANLEPWEKSLVLAQGTTTAMMEMAKLNPMTGLIAGFSEASNRAAEWGTELREVAHEVNRAMSRTFSDGLFNLFTGRKGEDLGRQFAESLLRTVTDTMGRSLAGTVSGIFGQVAGGFRAAVPGVTAGGGGGLFDLLGLAGQAAGQIISPTGAPAGSLVMTQGGQFAQVTPTGALQLVQSVQGAAGGGLGFDANTVLGGAQALYNGIPAVSSLATNFAIGGVEGALLGLQAITLGGQTILAPASTAGFLAAEIATTTGAAGVTGVTTGAGAGTSGFIGQGGALFGGTAGAATAGVLAAVALGFTIYGGLSQEATAQNIAINAISGAVSGAILGASVGLILGNVPGAIIGGVIGAIGGGAAAGGTTGLKAPKKMGAPERSRRVASAAADNLAGAIDQAASIEDLVTIFNLRWAPHGEVQIWTHYEGALYWAGDELSPAGAAATPELMVIPEFLNALGIAAGESGTVYVEHGRPEIRQDLIDKFRAKRDELLGVLSNIPFGILESDRAAGVTRRTYQPLQTLYGLEKGEHALFGSSDLLRRDLGAEENTIAFIFDRLREYSVRKDVDISRQDFMFR